MFNQNFIIIKLFPFYVRDMNEYVLYSRYGEYKLDYCYHHTLEIIFLLTALSLSHALYVGTIMCKTILLYFYYRIISSTPNLNLI